MTEAGDEPKSHAGRWLAVTLMVGVATVGLLVFAFLPQIAAVGLEFRPTRPLARSLLLRLELRAIDQYFDIRSGNWYPGGAFRPICVKAERDIPYRNRLFRAMGAPDRKDRFGNMLIHYAAGNGCSDLVQALLDRGVGIDTPGSDGWTPVMYAVSHGMMEVAKLLLEKGAEIGARNSEGMTPLMIAAHNGSLLMTELLAVRGSDIEVKTVMGKRALHLAAQSGNEAVVALLLDRGAATDARDDAGRTPLHDAVENGGEAVIALLLAKGGEVNARADNGTTCLDVAHYYSLDPKVADLLVRHGAKTAAELAAPPGPVPAGEHTDDR